jgi:protein arginine N-methyltransferase 1
MFDSHRAMLADDVRMQAYAAAIRTVVQPGDVVVDLGTGTGILAFLACEAGARHVYAIEKTHVADVAMFLARHHGISDRVTVLHEHSTKVELPERADVLVTETLGSFGLEERLLPSLLDARARLLRVGARVIPQRLVLSMVPVELPEIFEKQVGWWGGKRWGFDLSPLRTFAANTVYVHRIDDAAHLASPSPVIDVDLTTIGEPNVSGETTFVATRGGTVHGFAGWFRATLAPGIELTNATARATHWAQAFLPLEHPIAIEPGLTMRVELQSEGGRAWRWRGAVGDSSFDQTTWLDRPPCELTRE